jgi:hypothetical protein
MREDEVSGPEPELAPEPPPAQAPRRPDPDLIDYETKGAKPGQTEQPRRWERPL